ncbi:MAG: hypothetical protein COX79_02120 [Candidatus Levybacteria bacterium CG_4_10_14_0_2_um_filter_36_16]|nr:MAG: hypothetical protein AUK12_02455 [Candidatus Levybacteria bacterium CG2_30_37_29]PIR78797.1 MAG: hypothetical protein COU26_04660 [Candidatus Levybacteria bacterium CG10_big_fil_rev_8_21_14_0_10_36_30]PIZ97524.1 MAG: hypothetical protein COX79_02120 [Candidatus Levybacteria bacterium CG_4_10_14_0_2_um_filter_36_16]PJA90794.1 MAG: hypothetical protein CO136_00575 [Candidatus Levybacteria bacterium CG_4_9_14_3_um_filter_36_7]
MQPQTTDFKQLFTEIIHKQIVILGPDITIAKVKNVHGIEVDNTGQVTALTGDPQILLQALISQFVELSGLIVKKTMESILSAYPDGQSLSQQISNMQMPQALAGVVPPVSVAPQAPIQPPVEVAQASAQVSAQVPQTPIQGGTQDELQKMVQEVNASIAQVQGSGENKI